MEPWRPTRAAVVGLGTVGLPLALSFAEHVPTVGYDTDGERVAELRRGHDRHGEAAPERLRGSRLEVHGDPEVLRGADFVVLAVPTPQGAGGVPDMGILRTAAGTVGGRLALGATVTVESTVWPGATEAVVRPALEAASGLRAGRDFHLGYSPERVNPGDREHTVERVVKVVAGQTPEALERVAGAYGLIARSGVHRAPSLQVAEAAKLVENIQRDVNIALMNELARVFHGLGLDTREVLAAAGTKWNFARYEPGLVGGYCIPMAPLYLQAKADPAGLPTPLLRAARASNDKMPAYIIAQVAARLASRGRPIRDARVLVLGITFKEDVRDARSSRAVDLARALGAAGAEVWAHDPQADPAAWGLRALGDPWRSCAGFDAVVLAVPHRDFRSRPGKDYLSLLRDPARGVVADLRGVLPRGDLEAAGAIYWRL